MGPLVAMLRSLWRNLFKRRRAEEDLDAELRDYIELLTAEKIRMGMAPSKARRAALIECRGVDQVKERVREAWSGEWLVSAVREIRVVIRSLLRSPAYLLVSVATLGIGLGGATAVFTVVHWALLRPLPGAAEPDRLVTVERLQNGRQISDWSYADYLDLRERSTTLDGLAAYNGTSMTLEDAAEDTRAWVSYVSEDFFTVLGVRPAAGRLFGVAEGANAAAVDGRVAVLGYDLWQRRYGGTTDAIGARIVLDGYAYTVVGVAPRGFVGTMVRYPMELWIPLASGGQLAPALAPFGSAVGLDLLTSRRQGWLRLVGRLDPGATVEDAQRDLGAVSEWLASVYPTNRERSARVFAGAGATADERVELARIPRLLAFAVGLLLLIACGNVASLALVRSTGRVRELAARLALGATRATLVRQVAIEGAVLALAAGVVGVLLARVLVRSATLVGTVVPIPGFELTVNGPVLAVALVVAGLTALGVSVVPALRVLHVPATAVLRGADRTVGRTSSGARGHRLVVAGQAGASFVLLAAAAMIFSSFQHVISRHDLVDSRGIAYASFDGVRSISRPGERLAAYRELLDAAASEPAFAVATLASSIPPFNWGIGATIFRRGEEPGPDVLAHVETTTGTRASVVTVSEGYFDLMRLRVEPGRDFTAADDEGGELVVILGRRLAGALWPNQEALGQYISWPTAEGPDRAPLRVVGVAEDTRPLLPGGEVPAFMYVPFAQHPSLGASLVVRTREGGPVDEATWRRVASSAASAGSAYGTSTLYQRLSTELSGERTASAWVGVFGLIALLLAALGIYGVLSQSVLQRTRELAVRSTLGATPASMIAMVGGEALRLAAVGGALGVVGAAAAFRLVSSMFTAVDAPDVAAAVVAAVLLTVAVLGATWIPARRAASLDPASLLRSD